MKKIVSLILSFVFVFSLVSCNNSKSDSNTGEKNTTTHLNIAKQMVLGYIPLYIVEENGWIEEALEEAGYDIDVTFTQFESGPPENEAFATGLMDIGVMGNVPAISGIAAGQSRSIIGIAYNGEKTLGILVSKDSEIKSVSQLKGKKVGLVIGSISQDYLNAMLEDSNLKMGDVELINLGVSELESTLARGEVDAVAAWNPELLEIQANSVGRLLADGTGVYAGENVIVANKDYVEQNPEIVRIFMEQYQRGVNELLSNPEKYAKQYSEIVGLSEDLLLQTWKNSNFPVCLTEKDQSELEKTAKFLYEQKLISNEVNVAEHLDFSFSEVK